MIIKLLDTKTRTVLRSLFFLALCLCPGMSSAIMLSFNPSVQEVELGRQAVVDVYLRDPNGSRVGAFDFNVNYDSAVLSFNGVQFGAGLGASTAGSLQDVLTSTAGQVNVAELAFAFDLSPFQDGFSDFLLFSLTFDTVAVGISSLGFSENILGLAGGYLVDESGLPIGPIGTEVGQITVASKIFTVSEPGSLILLAAGIVGLLRRKFRIT